MAERRQLCCWAISAKRYVLYTMGCEGSPVIHRIVDDEEGHGSDADAPSVVKASEHGLGHLLNPKDPDDPSDHWIVEAWEWMLRQALGLEAMEPPWLDRPALTRVPASSPAVLGWFKAMNAGRSYADQIKPANFLLLAHPHPLDPSGGLPIAPYESYPSNWETTLRWNDRRNGETIRITTELSDGTLRGGVVHVRTYRQVLADYLAHPEAKSLGPDGKPVGRKTVGLLQRRPAEGVAPPRYIGKEGNRLDDRISGLVSRPDEYRTEYEDSRNGVWQRLVVPVLATMDRRTLIAGSGLHRRTIERYLYGGSNPRRGHGEVLTDMAVHHATACLKEWGVAIPRDPMRLLHLYIAESDSHSRDS